MKRISVFLLFASCVLAQGGHSVTIAITDGQQNRQCDHTVYRSSQRRLPHRGADRYAAAGMVTLLNATGDNTITYADTTVPAGNSILL